MAVNVFVGTALLLVAAAFVLAARRKPETVLLAVFLMLVGVNYVAIGVARVNGDERLLQIAFVANALDPFYLVAFVSLYPFSQRSRAVDALLVPVALAGLYLGYLAVLDPTRLVAGYPGAPNQPEAVTILTLQLIFAYGAAWLLALRAMVRAPTPLLRERARWMVVATGIVVVPRLAVLHQDLRIPYGPLLPEVFGIHAAGAMDNALMLGATALLALATLLAVRLLARRAATIDERRALVTVFVVAVAFTFVRLSWLVLQDEIGLPRIGSVFPQAFRWLVFAGVFAYGLLAYEAVSFRARGDRVLALLAAAIGATGGALAAAAPVADLSLDPRLQWPLFAMGGALGAFVSWRAVRRFLWTRPMRDAERERAIEMFRAVLEAAHARGIPTPGERRLLDRERARLGLTREAARTLEHVVRRVASGAGVGLAVGDEPLPGIVVEEELGRGAHGAVHAARRQPGGERLVLKQLAPEAGDGAATRGRFLAEVRALQALDHPRIVRLVDADVSSRRYLLVMQRIDARPLSEALAGGVLEEGATRVIVDDLLDALAAAHARGILHRDVKPSNILVDAAGRAHLADFGIARDARPPARDDATLATMEAAPAVAGTLRYMAPEQARGSVGAQSDLYSVGLVALECLTGRPARDLRGLALPDAMAAVALGEVDLEGAPDAWRAWLARALAPDPQARFGDARAMRDALPHARA